MEITYFLILITHLNLFLLEYLVNLYFRLHFQKLFFLILYLGHWSETPPNLFSLLNSGYRCYFLGITLLVLFLPQLLIIHFLIVRLGHIFGEVMRVYGPCIFGIKKRKQFLTKITKNQQNIVPIKEKSLVSSRNF